jgi:2-methylcitrate dehydratase PrpD
MISFIDFALRGTFEDLPAEVVAIMKRSVLDIIGVAAVGATTEIGRITASFARQQWCAGPGASNARIIFDGAKVAPAGAAFAGAFAIDSIDAHDGHSPVKGHAGSGIFPALLAFTEDRAFQGRPLSGREFLTAMAIGYEISYRSGLALHATTTDYHTSGAWTAVGAAAIGARLLGLTADKLRHAVGIAEYHGPRSQMMRCIDHPTMLRDGVGWGSPTGVTAAYMAQLGFTGAPAVTVERKDSSVFWSDLGQRWEIMNTHFKRYPVCRWAHPAIDAANDLMSAHQLQSGDVERVRIQTFHNATRLAGYDPKSMDELTYGVAFPTAIMIVRGEIGIREMSSEVLSDLEIRRISLATELVETEHYNRISLRERWADVTLYLSDGRMLQSPPRTPKGDPSDPLTDDEIRGKFYRFAEPILGSSRATRIEEAVSKIDHAKGEMDWLGNLVFARPPILQT